MDRRWFSPTLVASALGLLTFLSYLLTQYPGLAYTDSGELAAACATLGIAHPTGYPLFTIIGHVWTLLPWPSVIGGLNILAALFVAASVSVMFLLLLEFKTSKIVAAATALLYAWTSIIWTQALAIEVYSLHVLLLLTTLFFAMRTRSAAPAQAMRWLSLTAFAYGLMLTNHLSSAFIGPGLLLLALPSLDRKVWRKQALSASIGLLPLALYAYLPIRSAQAPAINWGMVHRSMDAFLYHVKGTQFGVWLFSSDTTASTNAKVFFAMLPQACAWVGLLAVVVGLVSLLRTHRRTAWALVLVVAGNLGISLGYGIPDIENYFLPSIVVIIIWCGVGLSRLVDVPRAQRFAPILFLLPVISAASVWKSQDRSHDRSVEAYTRLILDNAAPNAVIMSHQWDFFCSAAWYLQTVEGVRPDVTIVDKELLRRTWYLPYLEQRYPNAMRGVHDAAEAYMPYLQQFEAGSDEFMKDRSAVTAIQQRFVAVLNAMITSNESRRPIYITGEMVNEEQGFAAGYRFIPSGPLLRIVRDSVRMPSPKVERAQQIGDGLRGHRERLDLGLREVAQTSLAQAALYALQIEHNFAAFTAYRSAVHAIDPATAASRRLDAISVGQQ